MEKPNKIRQRVITVTALAISLSLAALLVSQSSLVLAQSNNSTEQNVDTKDIDSTITIPKLNGSININNATNKFVRDNINITFTDAASIAQDQVENGVVIRGNLASVQGFLTYAFNIANYDAGTARMVIVDAGNGQVLYTSQEMELRNGGIAGGHGFDCGGHYKHKHHGHYGWWSGMDKGKWAGGWGNNGFW